jgi:hypothetical protein
MGGAGGCFAPQTVLHTRRPNHTPSDHRTPTQPPRFPISPIETIASIFTPPKAETIRAIYRAGQVDGLAWAREQGWRVPAGFSVA